MRRIEMPDSRRRYAALCASSVATVTRQNRGSVGAFFSELSESIKLTHISCSGTEKTQFPINLRLDQLGVQGRTLLNLLRETVTLIVSRLRTEVQQVGDLHCIVTYGGSGDITVVAVAARAKRICPPVSHL